MKYWNKNKNVRQRCWTRVSIIQSKNPSEIKRWCQEYPSAGKFYFYYGSNNWWFEKSEDAIIFTLKWYNGI